MKSHFLLLLGVMLLSACGDDDHPADTCGDACTLPALCGETPDPCSCTCLDGQILGAYVCQGGCRMPLGDGAMPQDASQVDAGMTAPSCPATLPTQGASCPSGTLQCTYIECSTYGVAVASCSQSAWSVAMEPCAQTVCGINGDMMCDPGQLCVTTEGGAIFSMCRNEGPGPHSCASICGAGACISGSGVNWTCNGCPAGQQCP